MDFPTKWREQFGDHLDFVPLEDDEDLLIHADVGAVAGFNAKAAWYDRLHEFADLLEKQALELWEFRSHKIHGSNESIQSYQRAHASARSSLGMSEPSPGFMLRLVNVIQEHGSFAEEARKIHEQAPGWMRHGKKTKRQDIGLGRACETIAGRIRFYRGDDKASWKLVLRCLEWCGHDFSHLSDPRNTLKHAAGGYVRWCKNHNINPDD